MNKTVLYIIAGASLGILGPVLVYFGNPANMGVCAACFLRDSVGAFGFHQAKVVQYLRPEILGLIIGGFLASMLWSRNFTPVSGSAAFSRFFLGVFAMIGCLIFLGCPWRAFLRLGGGDMTAIAGLVGLFAGVFVGRFFKKNGYVIPENDATTKPVAFLPLIIAILLLIALVFGLKLGDNGALFSSEKGPGSQHANIFISLIFAIVIGIFMQRSKFCSVGAISKVFERDLSMFYGIVSIIVFASITNLALGQYKFGFEAQPIAHNDVLWNFLGMSLAGLCFSLSYGCPGKHLVQMGAGNLSSAVFVLGMGAGAAISHNFILASSGAGITPYAPYAVAIGFIYAIYVGVFTKKA
ncbi:YedE-related selenium metabolism membrane protein [Campylobacter concisus]|uniref:YedE-related selenium metabolism membrane protein n=1 Tax=Campylobacter concisus TaxID=199 RepID=A0A7S9R6N3_9BACT|nr:YedE family putative selenium transporter [Campylobacter concisus]QPH83892.1 YedE-related selenium metabolism membrane protein [Campylobacter concisus]